MRGNGREEFTPSVRGNQWTTGAWDVNVDRSKIAGCVDGFGPQAKRRVYWILWVRYAFEW